MPKSPFSDKYSLFRALLVAARKNADLSQADLAIKLSRPQSFISKYERGERRLDVVEFLEVAKALALDPSAIIQQLVADTNDSTPPRESR